MCIPTIFFSGEDILAEALAARCVAHSLPDFQFCSIRPGQGGRSGVEAKLESYIGTARSIPFLVMLDLDDAPCPPGLRSSLLRKAKTIALPSKMVLSVVTRESEAWILGDAERLANFLGIDAHRVPASPENLRDPKKVVVQLAEFSRQYKREICPEPDNKVGPGYNDVLRKFVREQWRPDISAQNCPSLTRTLDRLASLKEK